MARTSKRNLLNQGVISEVVLYFLEGENEGVEIRINPPRRLTVGRSEECDIFIAEKKISRTHCEIVVEKDGIFLHDLGSTNGTYVNAKKVSQTDLKDKDKVRVGTNIIQLAVTMQTEEAAKAAEASAAAIAAEAAASSQGNELADLFEADDAPSGVMDEVPDGAFTIQEGEPMEYAAAPPQ